LPAPFVTTQLSAWLASHGGDVDVRPQSAPAGSAAPHFPSMQTSGGEQGVLSLQVEPLVPSATHLSEKQIAFSSQSAFVQSAPRGTVAVHLPQRETNPWTSSLTKQLPIAHWRSAAHEAPAASVPRKTQSGGGGASQLEPWSFAVHASSWAWLRLAPGM
jgi:hypothetical protein